MSKVTSQSAHLQGTCTSVNISVFLHSRCDSVGEDTIFKTMVWLINEPDPNDVKKIKKYSI